MAGSFLIRSINDHHMDHCNLNTLDQLKDRPDLTVSEITGHDHDNHAMKVTQKPFDDVSLRAAERWCLAS